MEGQDEYDDAIRAPLIAERERLRKLLDVCRESMRVSQRFHPNVTDWRGVIAAIDHEIGAKELQTP